MVPEELKAYCIAFNRCKSDEEREAVIEEYQGTEWALSIPIAAYLNPEGTSIGYGNLRAHDSSLPDSPYVRTEIESPATITVRSLSCIEEYDSFNRQAILIDTGFDS